MNTKKTVEIRETIIPADNDLVRKLWIDYLTWGNNEMQQRFGVHPHEPNETVEHDIQLINKFLPPNGRLLLAFADGNVCGIGCLKKIDQQIGEIKRMYVDPKYRNIGAGRAILQNLLDAAKQAGYKKIRLDSPKFMEAAHALYRSFGFKEIPAYDEVEIPAQFRQYLIFMELDLH